MALAAEWVVAAREGDAEAFACLVRAELPAAYRMALSIVRSPGEAEDAVQEAFLRAWRDVPKLRDPDAWSGWFRRLVARAAIDVARRRRRIHEVDLEVAGERAAADDTAAAGDRVAVMAAFRTLTPDDRAVLSLRYLSDLEVPDVAAALGIPLGTAKSRLHRATQRLAAAMGGER